MNRAAELCMANARHYLAVAARFEAAGQITLADTMGEVAAGYIQVALRIDTFDDATRGAAAATS